MTQNEAMNMVWHMANMWLSAETQRFQQNPATNEWQDCLKDLLESHGVTSEGLVHITTEADAEEALSIVHNNLVNKFKENKDV